MSKWIYPFVFACVWMTTCCATELPDGFSEEVLAKNLNAATTMSVAPDGRVFIADQTGPLRVWKEGRLLTAPALDLSDRLDTYWERGLIGVTLHPDFPRTPHLFVLYVAKAPFTHHVLSRFTLVGDRADPASERVLLEGDDQKPIGGHQPGGHQGGPIRFGPDGKLYVALGEQTAGKPAQSLNLLQGKVLRLNADGTIPEDNPFYTQTTGKYRAIWTYGMRNPYGLTFQPETGRCFESDVGESSWEEVNELVAGGNYGWPEAEGMSKNPAFKNPIHTYPPAIGRCICGGTFYPRQPIAGHEKETFLEKWRGQFFFTDWAANWIRALDPDKPSNVVTFARGLNMPVAIEAAPDGSLLVLNRGTIWRDGKKWKADTGSLVRIRLGGAAQDAGPHFPPTLAATDLFSSFAPLTPHENFTPFQINAPPWQPGIIGKRWLSLPPGAKITVSADGEFEFPAGAIIIQHYSLAEDGAPFETQVLWLTGPRTARAAAYRWSNNAKEATLVEDGAVITLPGKPERHWLSPGAERNLNLDLVVVGFLLPMNLRQINRDDQIQSWSAHGWLAGALDFKEPASLPKLAAFDDASAPPELRVRSYLDVNCAACHHPGGPSRGNFDARFNTPLANQNVVDGIPAAGDLGLPGARVILPGHPEKSLMLQRLSRNDFFRMPPISVNNEPQPILPVLEEWIRVLKEKP